MSQIVHGAEPALLPQLFQQHPAEPRPQAGCVAFALQKAAQRLYFGDAPWFLRVVLFGGLYQSSRVVGAVV